MDTEPRDHVMIIAGMGVILENIAIARISMFVVEHLLKYAVYFIAQYVRMFLFAIVLIIPVEKLIPGWYFPRSPLEEPCPSNCQKA
jgi:hypothetical protein